MKHFTLTLVALMFFSLAALAQTEPEKQREVGVTLSNGGSFGATYRVGTASALWRFSALSSSIYRNSSYEDSTSSITQRAGAFLRVGREFRSLKSDNLELRYGLDVGYGYSINHYKWETERASDNYSYRTSQDHDIGLFGVVGANYIIDENLVIGAEFTPSIQYSRINSSREANGAPPISSTANTFNASISNALTLSVVYRF